MKKSLKLLAAIGMLSMLVSFVACNMQTEEQLLATKRGSEESGSSSGGDDTIGTSWGALFTETTHNPIDLQVWQNFSATYDDNGMNVKFKETEKADGVWFGGAIVQNNAAKSDIVYYDMSSVKKVSFKVKATQAMQIWAGYSNEEKTSGPIVKENVNVTTDWQTVTITSDGVKEAWAIFAFGCDNANNFFKNQTLYFKDVTYLDANNQSVSLKYAK